MLLGVSVIFIGISFLATSYAQDTNIPIAGSSQELDSKQLAVENFIKLMSDEKYEDLYDNYVDGATVYYDPNESYESTKSLSLNQAEANGVLENYKVDNNSKKLFQTEAYKKQREYIKKNFGENAWNNVEFTIEKVPSLDTSLVWVDSEGKQIDEKKALKLIDDYWHEVSVKENIDLDVVLKPGRPHNAPEQREKIVKATQVLKEYSNNLPAKMINKEKSELYLVKFNFKCEGDAVSNIKDVTAYISNKNGKWKISNFQWSHILNEEFDY